MPSMASLYGARPPSTGYKIKWYTNVNKLSAPLYDEFQMLRDNNYTHVVDIPGQPRELYRISRHFGIVLMSKRMPKNIADMCSRTLCRKQLGDMHDWKKNIDTLVADAKIM